MLFAELHMRSAFSFLRGASNPDDMAEAAARAGLETAALCDRDGVYGAPRFYAACKEKGVRPIVGAELTLEDGSALPVLAETRQGYQNLCRLITQAQLRAEKGMARVRYEELPQFRDGLIALSGDYQEGPLALAWRRGGKDETRKVLEKLLNTFPAMKGRPDLFYMELQRHHLRGEQQWERCLRDLAEAYRLPLVASNGPCYAMAPGRAVQDVFTCIREHTHLDAAGRLLNANAERHVKGPREMLTLFQDVPEALANSLVVADRCQFTLENLGYEFPRYPVPAGETMDSFLRKLTWFGADQRYGSITPPVRKQIEHELALISKLGFSGYFLIVWDIVNYCREESIMVQGRGSAANSAVCYSLGITAADPVGGKLLFERFLSEGRKSWPDIDLDLPSGERREKVIQEVYRRYGKHGAAMTANVITYRGRSAMREICKALNLPQDVADRFSGLFAHGDYPHTMDLAPQLEQAGLPAKHPRTQAVMNLYRSIYGMPRHLGQHSGGMIICQGQLSSIMPLENASMPGRVVAQWDKDDCEDLGIIKVDLLGLGMMAVMQDALELTRQRGHPVDLAHIPKDDEETFRLMQAADTIGVFQIESRAQMATLPRLKPTCFYDVVIQVAIIRPGPIQGEMVHPYLERRAGRQEVDYIHPSLQPVLERTLGVCLFQEQILKIAMVIAGFSGSDAEELRRALNIHRENKRLERAKAKLEKAMIERGVEKAVRDKIIQALSSFALYGFPESHAISFALIAYGSAYLKVHYPAEFYTGLLNNQPMGFYSSATLIQDARRRGVQAKPPCVMASDWDCTIEDDNTIRLGLRMIKGLSERHGRALVEERRKRPFTNGADFLHRCALNADERQALASVGALNVFYKHRRAAMWHVAEAPDPGSLFSLQYMQDQADAATGDDAGDYAGAQQDAELSPLEAMSYVERLQADYSGMGLTAGKHPMAHLRERLPQAWPAVELRNGRHGQRVTIAGTVICRQRPGTAKGFVFVSLEDETGVSNAVVRPQLFEKKRLVITQEPALMITGILQIMDGVVCIRSETIEPLIEERLPTAGSHDFH